jgi:hypothetical protein
MTRTERHLVTSLLAVGSLVAAGASTLAGPAVAQHTPPAEQTRQAGDKTPATVAPREGCTDCRGADVARPDSSTVPTGDGKTTVPKSLMRDQADFRLNGAIKNVPGVTRR